MHPSDFGAGVIVFNSHEIRLAEVPGPELLPEVRAAMDAAWDVMSARNPALFDGPVILCSDMEQQAGRLDIGWSRATFRYRTLRGVPDAPALASMFVCVLQPTTDGRLVVGRMAGSTASPGVLQLPGGILEPPPAGHALTMEAIADHAAVELREETGIEVTPAELRLWAVARRSNANLGFFFLAPSVSAAVIAQGRASAARADESDGRAPEFDQLILVEGAADLGAVDGHPVDYLMPLVERLSSLRQRPGS